MNLKLLIAFLVLPFCGKAQITLGITGTADTAHKPTYFQYNGTLKMNTSYPTDTVKCIMLVCDTSLQHYNNFDCMNCIRSGYNPLVTWQIGYSYHTDLIHIGYLDENKKPLSKNIIVWMSKKY